ncbi:MAG: galactokinase family protein [Candidatus Aminicenantales bacterium]
MKQKQFDLSVSSPGRICLFGEHQDYFGLGIIAAAVNLRITIRGQKRRDRKFVIDLPDVEGREEFGIDTEIPYDTKRDYLKSGVNVLRRRGIDFYSGWDVIVRGTIPINAGSASSSALVVAWNQFLLEAGRNAPPHSPEEIAELGYLSEVAEFKEPGGKMDHFASALGGVVWIQFDEPMKLTRLSNPLQTFVLANSLKKKDTTGMLGYIKSHVLEGVAQLQKKFRDFNLKSPLTPEVEKEIDRLPADVRRLLKGTLLTRDLTRQGAALFQADEFNHARFGKLLSAQHEVLRHFLQTSTPKIEQMIEASLAAGALGAKINGSGGGGCMFAYAPENPEKVAEAVEKIGARVYIVRVDEGVRREH